MGQNIKVSLVLSIILLSLLNLSATRIKYKNVRTTKGFIKGIQEFSLFENQMYYSFRGIPYAAPPLHELRFRSPVEPLPWRGVRNTVEFGKECIQITTIFKVNSSSPNLIGDEDCLYLNVYTPDLKGNLPVLLWIHGGAFHEGSSNLYGADFIIDENVILVTFNYRLGPFGFLSLGTKEHSGNMALEDQLLALKWVNENIGNFGGDKNRITISGESAGGALVHFLTVSQASENLFQRSIIMSGSILNIWSICHRKTHVADMYNLAKSVNSSINTEDDLLKFLLNVDAANFIEQTYFNVNKYIGGSRKFISSFQWAPIVETPYYNYDYLFETGEDVIRLKNSNSKIDTMFGYTNKEMLLFLTAEIKNPSELQSFNEKYEVQLPLNYNDEIMYDSEIYRQISKKIHEFYFGIGILADNNTMLEYVDLLSDTWFRYGIILSAKIQAKLSTGKTFIYEFAVDDELNALKKRANITLPGAGHTDEICYLFRCRFPNLYDNIVENSVSAIKNMAKLWTNFVKYGNPTIDKVIKPIENNIMNYFKITNHGVEIDENPRSEAVSLWDEIYTVHGKSFLKTNILNG